MKLYSIFLIVLLVGCIHRSDNPEYNYTIINNSGKDVSFIPYSYGVAKPENKVFLLNGKSLNESNHDFHGISMGTLLFGNTFNGLTHIEIVFSNEKKVKYEECSSTFNCNLQDRNILNSQYNGELTETYTITPEDYQNATPCNGNCY